MLSCLIQTWIFFILAVSFSFFSYNLLCIATRRHFCSFAGVVILRDEKSSSLSSISSESRHFVLWLCSKFHALSIATSSVSYLRCSDGSAGTCWGDLAKLRLTSFDHADCWGGGTWPHLWPSSSPSDLSQTVRPHAKSHGCSCIFIAFQGIALVQGIF